MIIEYKDLYTHFVLNTIHHLSLISENHGAAAFSVSKFDVNKVCNYIFNQPEHHRKKSFKEEIEVIMKYYLQPLKTNKVDNLE